jgi:hypothetical protein
MAGKAVAEAGRAAKRQARQRRRAGWRRKASEVDGGDAERQLPDAVPFSAVHGPSRFHVTPLGQSVSAAEPALGTVTEPPPGIPASGMPTPPARRQRTLLPRRKR